MILLDTCALIWSVEGSPLSPAASEAIREARARSGIYLSPVSAWELGILADKGRLLFRLPVEKYVADAFSMPGVRLAALTPSIAVMSSRLPGRFHEDPGDRLLVATARALGLPIVTRDRRILDYARKGHVNALPC